MSIPACPQCHENYAYEDGHIYVCPMCCYEWTEESEALITQANQIVDSNGNPLLDGDDVIVIKDLKLGSDVIKKGTKVKSIKLLDEIIDDHDISAKIDGIGSVYLKSSVVKK